MAAAPIPKNELDLSSPSLNRVAEADSAVHRWYRFVLSFPPHLVRSYLEKFEVGPNSLVLDPFCGTGTTIVECKKMGIPSVGVEASPMAALACKVKVNWTIAPDALRTAAHRIREEAERIYREEAGQLELHGLHVLEPRSLYGLRTLPAEAEALLLKGSISPVPQHKALLLRDLIDDSDPPVRDPLRVALAWALVNEVGNLRFGPEVGVTKPKADAEVFAIWHAQVERMAEDLEAMRAGREVAATALRGDSRALNVTLQPQSLDAVITSPPYPNEKDYTRTTRLESVMLGLIRDKEELRRVKKDLVRSNTRSVYVSDTDDEQVLGFPEIQRIAADIENRRVEMGKTSGFERLYHRVTKLYFGGMRRHLESLQPYLKPGARLAYVVGDQASYLQIMVRTGTLLADIAAHCGYEVEAIDLFRTRAATATRMQLREEVVVLRWYGGR